MPEPERGPRCSAAAHHRGRGHRLDGPFHSGRWESSGAGV